MRQTNSESSANQATKSSDVAKLLSVLIIVMSVLGSVPIVLLFVWSIPSMTGGSAGTKLVAWSIVSLLLACCNSYLAVRVMRSTMASRGLWTVVGTSLFIVLSFVWAIVP